MEIKYINPRDNKEINTETQKVFNEQDRLKSSISITETMTKKEIFEKYGQFFTPEELQFWRRYC